MQEIIIRNDFVRVHFEHNNVTVQLPANKLYSIINDYCKDLEGVSVTLQPDKKLTEIP